MIMGSMQARHCAKILQNTNKAELFEAQEMVKDDRIPPRPF